METQPREIRLYTTPSGKVPFAEWFDSLRSVKTQTIINKRLNRVRLGNFGDFKALGSSVFEPRIDYGSGYRIYFAQDEMTLMILLCGGDKSTQDRNIEQAKEYWADYGERKSAD